MVGASMEGTGEGTGDRAITDLLIYMSRHNGPRLHRACGAILLFEPDSAGALFVTRLQR